jgi:hypothetical protein
MSARPDLAELGVGAGGKAGLYRILHEHGLRVTATPATGVRGRRVWHDFSPGQRLWIILLGAVQAGLIAAALRDVVHRPAAELTAPKPVWVGACFVNFIGPLAYFVVGRRRSSRAVRRYPPDHPTGLIPS